MSSAIDRCTQLISEFTENFMEKLFYFGLKKTGSGVEAEELTQDIALNILTALHRGTIPDNFPAWVWQIARNRYSVWASGKHRRSELLTCLDIGDYELEDKHGDILDDMIHKQELALIRRELSFISSEYRHIVVAYYIEGQSLRDIAAKSSLSLEAVKKRLQRARTILKEGMNMAREFGVRSYKPEQVVFVQNGGDGAKGQPWSIINHLLYKNIFLETYENPETAEELALELGIALPYMEDELEYLVREELLRKTGHKYEPSFLIVSRGEQRRIYEAGRAVQKVLTDRLCALIELYMQEGGAKVNVNYVGYEAAKWTLLASAFDQISGMVNGQEETPCPSRPDGGTWTLTGYETVDWQEPDFVGLHMTRSDKDGKDRIEFGQYKFYVGGFYTRTPEHLANVEAHALHLVCMGRAEEAAPECVEKLLGYGYLKRADGILSPQVVVFDRNARERFPEKTSTALAALREEITALIAQTPSVTKAYVVDQALQDGWLKMDEQTLSVIGAYIYL